MNLSSRFAAVSRYGAVRLLERRVYPPVGKFRRGLWKNVSSSF